MAKDTPNPNKQNDQGPQEEESQDRDLGFGTSIGSKNRRLINRNGGFNVHRVGLSL